MLIGNYCIFRFVTKIGIKDKKIPPENFQEGAFKRSCLLFYNFIYSSLITLYYFYHIKAWPEVITKTNDLIFFSGHC